MVIGCCLLRCCGKKVLFLKVKNSLFVLCLLLVIWLVYVFVEEDYYVCVKFGCLDIVFVKVNIIVLKDVVNKEFFYMKFVLELIVWGLIFGFVIFFIIFVMIYCMCMFIDFKF